MTNTMTKRLVSALVTMALLLSVVVGGTYAYFTDSVSIKDNVITAGSISVDADLFEEGTTAGTYDSAIDRIELTNFAPGDSETYKLVVTNDGSLDAQYKILLTATDIEFAEALTITYTIDGTTADLAFTDNKFQTDWADILATDPDTTVDMLITIALNNGAGVSYQSKVFAFNIDVLATQVGATPDNFDFIAASNYTEDVNTSIDVVDNNLYNNDSELGVQTNYCLVGTNAQLTPITTKLPDFDVDSLYVNVGYSTTEITHLTINGHKYYEDNLFNVLISIGNANLLYMPAYKVVDNNLYIAAMVLNMESALGNSIIINDDITLVAAKNPPTNILTVTNVEAAEATVTQNGTAFTLNGATGSSPLFKVRFAELTDPNAVIMRKAPEYEGTYLYYAFVKPDLNNGNPEYWTYPAGYKPVDGNYKIVLQLVYGDYGITLDFTTTIG